MKIFNFLRTTSKNKKRSTIESGKLSIRSNPSEISIESEGQKTHRVLNSDWPIFDLVDSDRMDYDDDSVSISSLDMSIWKSAPTDNEAPPMISKKELEQHSTSIDAWVAINGLVYDVTTFLDIHPGGYQELWKGVGRDATNLFMKVHPYVNIRKHIGKHCVGVYIAKPSSFSRVLSTPSTVVQVHKSQRKPNVKNMMCCIEKNFGGGKRPKDDPEGHFQLRFTQNQILVVLEVKAPPALNDLVLDPECWTFVIWDNQMLFIKVMWSPEKCWVAQYKLHQEIEYESVYVSFRERNAAIIMIPKGDPQEHWTEFGQPVSKGVNCIVRDFPKYEFDDATRALLFYRRQLTHNVVLYGFKLRPSSYFGVPMGQSMVLTVDEGAARIFPTTFTFMDCMYPICEIKGQTFYFIISQEFAVSQGLNSLKSMDEKEMMEAAFICIGSPYGSLSSTFLDNVDTLVLLASGVGIAPLSRIIHLFRDKHPEHTKTTHVLLLYFNRTKADVIWYQELVDANANYSWFHLFLIAEEPDASWDQLIGSISLHLVKWCMKAIPGVTADGLIVNGLASGEGYFLDSCQRIFQDMQDYFDNAAVFEPATEVLARTKI